jgi:hypothetical protein
MGDYYVSPSMLGDYYVSPSLIGDYYISPSMMGRCCFTINTSIFLRPLRKQFFILMLCAYKKKNKYQSYSLLLDLIRTRTHELPNSTITITPPMTFSPYIFCRVISNMSLLH